MNFFNRMPFLSVCAIVATVCFSGLVQAQSRDRVVKQTASRPTNLPPAAVHIDSDKTQPLTLSRPALTNEIRVVNPEAAETSLVKKTVSSTAVTNAGRSAAKSLYAAGISARLDQAIKERYGLRYRYGSSGPNTYDCSGFVWAVFGDAGVNFTRSSARTMWAEGETVTGDERFKFGTLVFLNGLGHVGIVADENGFYHASTSKGITYSPFKGYWQKRIVGFKRLNPVIAPAPVE